MDPAQIFALSLSLSPVSAYLALPFADTECAPSLTPSLDPCQLHSWLESRGNIFFSLTGSGIKIKVQLVGSGPWRSSRSSVQVEKPALLLQKCFECVYLPSKGGKHGGVCLMLSGDLCVKKASVAHLFWVRLTVKHDAVWKHRGQILLWYFPSYICWYLDFVSFSL